MNSAVNAPQTPDTMPTDRIQLSAGFSTTRAFFDEVRLHIANRLQDLPPGRTYTAKKLAGKPYWDLLTDCDRRIAGRCVAHAVGKRLLPLTFVRGEHEYPLRYSIK